MAELQRKVEDRVRKQQHYVPYSSSSEYTGEFDLDLQELNALKLQKKHVQDSFNKSIRMLTQSCVPDMGFYTGRLEYPDVPRFSSEFGDGSALRKRKKKSLTPINDYDTVRDKWQWYPKDSTESRESTEVRHLPNSQNSRNKNETKTDARPKYESNQNKGSSQSVPIGSRFSQRTQSNGRSLFPAARLGPVPKAPQASRLKNVLKVNPMHNNHGYE